MQRYVLQIIEHLEDKGYKKLNPDSNNVYGRVYNDAVYVVVVGSSRNLKTASLRQFNEKIKKDLSENTEYRIELLNIMMTPNGMLDDDIKDIINNMNNVWIFSEDYGQLYLYENQPEDFDGLYSILDRKIYIEKDSVITRIKKLFGIVTPCLVLVNLIIYIISVFTRDAYGESIIIYKMALNLNDVVEKHQYYRLVTAMFVHFNLMHLTSNMIILIALGARIENMIGRKLLLTAYGITGIVASTASLISCYLGNLYDYAGGASGAIFGLMGIMIVIAFFNKGHVSGISIWNLIVLSVLTILNGYVSEGIDNVAHIGGLVSGIIVGIIIILSKQKVVKNIQI
jgi:rhomboid protease GluP